MALLEHINKPIICKVTDPYMTCWSPCLVAIDTRRQQFDLNRHCTCVPKQENTQKDSPLYDMAEPLPFQYAPLYDMLEPLLLLPLLDPFPEPLPISLRKMVSMLELTVFSYIDQPKKKFLPLPLLDDPLPVKSAKRAEKCWGRQIALHNGTRSQTFVRHSL